MKAGVLEQVKQPVVIKNVPDPTVGPGDVLIRVQASGICRTDVHIADGWMKDWFGLDPFPIIPGHEVAGVVEQVGQDVTQFKQGDRVMAYYLFTCGRCQYCLSGQEQTCETLFTGFNARGFTSDGGYAEYMTMPEQFVIRLPDSLDFITAAPFICGGLTAYGGLKKGQVRPGQRVAILGIGGIGHLAIKLARAMGAEVIAITSEGKEDLARELGAHEVVTRENGHVGQKLRDMGGVNTVISATVDPVSLGQIIQGVAPRGNLIIIGLTPPGEPAISFEPGAVLFGQQNITGNLMGTRWDMHELLDLAARTKIQPVSEVYSLEEVNKAHERLRNNQVRFRAVLTI
jgi:alcohol dehydrogenase, propanol-preferring